MALLLGKGVKEVSNIVMELVGKCVKYWIRVTEKDGFRFVGN